MDAKFFTLNIHAGITESEVVEFIYKSIESVARTQQKVIIFFDEVNKMHYYITNDIYNTPYISSYITDEHE
jgi:MoxR-like ATPase